MLAHALLAFANFQRGDYLHVGYSIPVTRFQAARVDLVRPVTRDETEPATAGRMHP